jgi:REP element-mobilizing transposase RayT
MARKPRIHLSGGLYHVILRGNRGMPVFLTDADRYRLYLLLQEGTFRFGYRVLAFCLMTNHIHLALQVSNIPLSSGLHNLFQLVRYIHLNPVRASLSAILRNIPGVVTECTLARNFSLAWPHSFYSQLSFI